MDEFDDDDLDISFGEEDLSKISCLNETVVSENVSCGESSFESSALPSSTPKKRKGKAKALASSPEVFKKPSAPASVFGKCPICHRGLKTEKGLKNHVQAHKWKDAAKRRPSVEDICQHLSGKLIDVIELLIKEHNSLVTDHTNQRQQQVLCCLKDLRLQQDEAAWISFSRTICGVVTETLSKDTGAALPSALRPRLQGALSASFSSAEFRDNVLDSFEELTQCDESISWCVIFSISKRIVDEALVYLSKNMRGANATEESCQQPSQKSFVKDDFNHHMSIQVIHHAAGSALKTHLRKAYTYPKNSRLKRIKMCILTRFAKIGSPSVVEKRDARYWTSLLNRKSLLFINDKALPFFIGLGHIFQGVATPKGVQHDAVIERLLSTPHLLGVWDDIVGTSLNEDESFFFMVKVVRSLTNTFGKGLMIKIMNERFTKGKEKGGKSNKATIAVSHRARLI